eukprot:SAG22_NODE_5521_length_1000_cov_1.208657_1_plen_126_part_01
MDELVELQEALDTAEDKLHDQGVQAKRLEAENAELHAENKRLRRKSKKGVSVEEAAALREEVADLRDQREDYQEEIGRLTVLVEEGAGSKNWQARAEAVEVELEDAQDEMRALEGEMVRLEKGEKQ